MAKRNRDAFMKSRSEYPPVSIGQIQLKQVISALRPETPEEEKLIHAFKNLIANGILQAIRDLADGVANKITMLCLGSTQEYRIPILAAMRQGMVDFTEIEVVYDINRVIDHAEVACDIFEKLKFLDKFQLQNMLSYLRPAIDKLDFLTSPQYEARLAAYIRGEFRP